jgi:voltage-gated potassium channel
MSILPTFLSLFFGGAQFLSIIRLLRMVRIFRIFNLREYIFSGLSIMAALHQSQKKITVFLLFILLMVSVFGGVMYVVESGHPESGFASIPKSIYWAIVTITTVGYGDISPVTPLGQFIASIIMIMGYAVIAVPTGIVTAEISKQRQMRINPSQHCSNCGHDDHLDNANFCCKCGDFLHGRGL